MKVSHIVLPTDLSGEALRPCKAVAEFAKAQGARITLLYVVQDLRIAAHGSPLAAPMQPPSLGLEESKAAEALEKQRAELPADIDVQTVVLTEENVPNAVVKYAEEHDADLIALSTHGRTGFRHLVLGSSAESILRHSSIPVLAFPRGK